MVNHFSSDLGILKIRLAVTFRKSLSADDRRLSQAASKKRLFQGPRILRLLRSTISACTQVTDS
jgi:hypothetical protein